MITVIAAADAAEIDVDGLVDTTTGVRYIGKATRDFDGRWVCLAILGETMLCRVEVGVTPTVHVDQDLGDEDDRAAKDAKLDRDLPPPRPRSSYFR